MVYRVAVAAMAVAVAARVDKVGPVVAAEWIGMFSRFVGDWWLEAGIVASLAVLQAEDSRVRVELIVFRFWGRMADLAESVLAVAS